MKKMVVLTGAGISAESGIRTFRDSGGLWEQYRVEDVATPEAWQNNTELVRRFYNERRTQLAGAQPNDGHRGLAALEDLFEVHIVTQNVDDLHERAGSRRVLHLHGQLTMARSSIDPDLITEIGYREILPGERASDGSLLRPHIVWFGEAVPAMEEAIMITAAADIFVIIGTSLKVYPAAGLVHYVPAGTTVFVIDPAPAEVFSGHKTEVITAGAGEGVRILTARLKEIYSDRADGSPL